jgi:hypothetical protein
MRTCLSTLIVLALLSVMTNFGNAQSSCAPSGISYQGLALVNGIPVNGMHSITVTYHTAGNGGAAQYSETFPSVDFGSQGIFNIILGQAAPGNGFPSSFDFNQQYWIEVSIDNQPPLPRTALWSVPYAFNACTVGGVQVSLAPMNGKLWPVPLDASGKISSSVLPPNNLTIAGVSPDGNGNINITGSNGIMITPNPGNHSIDISMPSIVGITSIQSGMGLQVSDNGHGVVSLSIGPGAVAGSMLAPALGSHSFSDLDVGDANDPTQVLTVTNKESNGSSALIVDGGIAAGNPTGAADGTGLTALSKQVLWADQVTVPSGTAATMTVYNALVSSTSTIVLTPVYSGAGTIVPLSVSGVAAGQFTVNAPTALGTGGGGSVSAINYIVVNH